MLLVCCLAVRSVVVGGLCRCEVLARPAAAVLDDDL